MVQAQAREQDIFNALIPTSGNRHTWYNIALDNFEIRGKNFNSARLVNNGAGLLRQLRGFGVVTKWTYSTPPSDPNGHQ